jgi:hypothetical protein
MGYWSVSRKPGSSYVLLVYKGVLTGDDGELASRRFVELVGGDRIYFVADFTGLVKYESRVRTDWQKNVWPIRRQIIEIFCATTNSLVRMGVGAFALFIAARVTFFKTSAELSVALTRREDT